MSPRASSQTGRLAAGVFVAAAALAGATVVVAILEGPLGLIADASPVYLVAVVTVGLGFGTWPAIGTAVAAFILYDLLFVEPRFTLVVEDPREWLDLLLFLFVGVAIGRLTARVAERASDASRRAAESVALFRISRTLATTPTVVEALPPIVALLVDETDMDRIWVSRETSSREIVLADSRPTEPREMTAVHVVLTRMPGDEPARWVRTHAGPEARPRVPRQHRGADVYRIRIEADGELAGMLWATRPRDRGFPGRGETRLLSLAADQLGLALRRENLIAQANRAEVARQGEVVKTALLESVSHDLRTPLASIRAAAGSLIDPEIGWTDQDRQAAALQIDAEAERLDRLVRNLLDLSRIEGGALTPELELFDLADLVEPILARLAPILPTDGVQVDIPVDLPPVSVDAVYLDEIVTNLLENAARHASGARVRLRAREVGGSVALVVEDGGPGVSAEAMPRLFDKFFRIRRRGDGPRRGLGIGLSVVKGLADAMGSRVNAARSELGGLAVELTLPIGVAPPSDARPAP